MVNGAQADSHSNRMSELAATVSRKPIPEHQKTIIFEITAEDQTEEDVEIPYVMVTL